MVIRSALKSYGKWQITWAKDSIWRKKRQFKGHKVFMTSFMLQFPSSFPNQVFWALTNLHVYLHPISLSKFYIVLLKLKFYIWWFGVIIKSSKKNLHFFYYISFFSVTFKKPLNVFRFSSYLLINHQLILKVNIFHSLMS